MKHVIDFKDGSQIVFEPPQNEGLIQITVDENLPQLDAVGEFIRVYCEDGLQYLYPAADVKRVVSATTTEAEALL